MTNELLDKMGPKLEDTILRIYNATTKGGSKVALIQDTSRAYAEALATEGTYVRHPRDHTEMGGFESSTFLYMLTKEGKRIAKLLKK